MKILYITPHLSTGGLPQYLLKKIKFFIAHNDIYVIEWNNISGNDFVVQRNQIIKLISNKFYSLGQNKNIVIDLINSICPDVVHFEELPETFISNDVLDNIFDIQRNYKIVCTTHSSASRPEKLTYLADKFILVSHWSKKIFESYFKDIPCEIWEYPIEKKVANKIAAQKKLNFDKNYKHVLNVGLFTQFKNQKELIDLARKFLRYDVKFHFVGNQALNFEEYWKPLMDDLPSNCIIHGERNDVDLFYQAADLFYFPSNLELNPLVVKEALSYNLPTYIKNLHTYENTYDNIVKYISDDQEHNFENIINELKLIKKKSCIRIVHNLMNINDHREKISIESVSKLSEYHEYIQCVYERYVGDDWKKQEPAEGWMNHGPGHYGCFDSMKKSIIKCFTDDIEALLICESDCVIDIEIEKFNKLLKKAIDFANKHEIPYISFSPKIIDSKLLSKNLGEDAEFDEFIFTDEIYQTHCFLITKYYKNYLFEKLNTSWGTPDLWFNSIYKNKKIAICRDELTHQELGISAIDQYAKGFSIDTSYNNGKLHLVFLTARRYNYFEKTVDSLFSINPELKDIIEKTWLFDDRSTNEDRSKMSDLLRHKVKDNFNCIYFNSDENFRFVDKFNFVKKISNKNDCILLIEDDWVCLEKLNILDHWKKLCSTNWSQIAFADSLGIQDEFIQKNYRLNGIYWKNPWPNNYKHIYKLMDRQQFYSIVRMNNWTNNPSIIKASVFHEHDFKKEKNFEAIFADTVTRNQYFTNKLLFQHIGEESLIDKI